VVGWGGVQYEDKLPQAAARIMEVKYICVWGGGDVAMREGDGGGNSGGEGQCAVMEGGVGGNRGGKIIGNVRRSWHRSPHGRG